MPKNGIFQNKEIVNVKWFAVQYMHGIYATPPVTFPLHAVAYSTNRGRPATHAVICIMSVTRLFPPAGPALGTFEM